MHQRGTIMTGILVVVASENDSLSVLFNKLKRVTTKAVILFYFVRGRIRVGCQLFDVSDMTRPF